MNVEAKLTGHVLALSLPDHHITKEFCEKDGRFPVWVDEW